MKKIITMSLIILSHCSLIQNTSTENIETKLIEDFTGAYTHLQKQGDVFFNYCTKNGIKYWMWANFNVDENGKQTFVAHFTDTASGTRYKFYRNAVDVLFSNDPKYANSFIIDFGKKYNKQLPRFMYVKRNGNAFRGKMMDDYIKWEVDTEFQIQSTTMPVNTVNSPYYNNVATHNNMFIGDTLILPFGKSSSFDALRNYDVVGFNYYTDKKYVKYYMWLDLRVGLNNEMALAYHKVGEKNSQYFELRQVVNVLTNRLNPNEFIIDLGIPNGEIKRYLYVKKDRNVFRGSMLDSPRWTVVTKFNISADIQPDFSYYKKGTSYKSVKSSGSILEFNNSDQRITIKDNLQYRDYILNKPYLLIVPARKHEGFYYFLDHNFNILQMRWVDSFRACPYPKLEMKKMNKKPKIVSLIPQDYVEQAWLHRNTSITLYYPPQVTHFVIFVMMPLWTDLVPYYYSGVHPSAENGYTLKNMTGYLQEIGNTTEFTIEGFWSSPLSIPYVRSQLHRVN